MSAFKEFAELKNAIRFLRKNNCEPKKGSVEYTNLKALFDKFSGKEWAIGNLTSMCECGRLGTGGSISALRIDSPEYVKYTTTAEVPGKMCEVCIKMFMLMQRVFDTDEKETNLKNTQIIVKLIMDLRVGKLKFTDKGNGNVSIEPINDN
jgi:hypothetical protein